MIKTYSQRHLPPYYGQVQIAESARARALSIDGQSWEIQFLHAGHGGSACSNNSPQTIKHSYRRVASISHEDIRANRISCGPHADQNADERILELTDFLADICLPFPAADRFEYWLLDAEDQSPLALIFSCRDALQMQAYPSHPEWTALPAAVMPIEMSAHEKSYASAPVNYRLERLVAERAGARPRAKWFTRHASETGSFPPLMVKEDWQTQENADLCQRYLRRQSARLLMLHGLDQSLRRQLEINARAHALEVERFYPLYPDIIDQALIDAIRVEARLRRVSEGPPAINQRRDGIHYL